MKIITIALTALLQCLSVGAQVAGSIDLSDPGAGNNMTFVVDTNPASEAYSIATTMSGIDVGISLKTNTGISLLLIIPFYQRINNLLVTITFYDNDSDNFSFHYNSTSGDYTQVNFSKNGTDSWVTATLLLTRCSI
jgi:hypothetical protein